MGVVLIINMTQQLKRRTALKIYFYLRVCVFVNIHMFVQMPMETTRECQIPQEQEVQLSHLTSVLGTKPRPLQEQYTLLAAEPSL